MNMVTVATFNEPVQAEPLKQRLVETGILAKICDESKYEWFWFVTKPVAGIRLKVKKSDFELALRLLQEWDVADGALRDAVRCPQCGSSRIEYPQFTRKFLMPNLVGFASIVGIIEKQFFCQKCDLTWPKDTILRSPKKHTAPNFFIEGVEEHRRAAFPGAQE